MSVFYYQNNEVLLPPWRSAPTKKMPWGWLLAALLLVALLGVGAWYWGWSVPEQNAKQAVVFIRADVKGDGTLFSEGSGAVIHPTKGYILTNKHVVFGQEGQPVAGPIEVHYMSGTDRVEVLQATLETQSDGAPGYSPEELKNDWAVLRVNRQEPMAYLPLDEATEFQEEEPLKVYGFPLGSESQTNKNGPAVKVLHGIVTRVDRNDQSGVTRLTHDAKSVNGMSGGPVTCKGKIVGLNTMILLERDDVDPNENYALPTFLILEQIKNFRPEK